MTVWLCDSCLRAWLSVAVWLLSVSGWLCGCAPLQVPRQRLIQVDLLDQQPLDTADLQVPPGGMTVPHIRCVATVYTSMRVVLCVVSCEGGVGWGMQQQLSSSAVNVYSSPASRALWGHDTVSKTGINMQPIGVVRSVKEDFNADAFLLLCVHVTAQDWRAYTRGSVHFRDIHPHDHGKQDQHNARFAAHMRSGSLQPHEAARAAQSR